MFLGKLQFTRFNEKERATDFYEMYKYSATLLKSRKQLLYHAVTGSIFKLFCTRFLGTGFVTAAMDAKAALPPVSFNSVIGTSIV